MKRARTSAGILLYRRSSGALEVLLVHPGGPFWKNRDDGAWSIPKGEIDAGEDPLAAAKRELAEETGYAAAEWTRFGVIHTAVAYTDEGIELFLAKRLTEGTARPDAGEFLENVILPFGEALARVRDGRITDAKTVAALLWVKDLG